MTHKYCRIIIKQCLFRCMLSQKWRIENCSYFVGKFVKNDDREDWGGTKNYLKFDHFIYERTLSKMGFLLLKISYKLCDNRDMSLCANKEPSIDKIIKSDHLNLGLLTYYLIVWKSYIPTHTLSHYLGYLTWKVLKQDFEVTNWGVGKGWSRYYLIIFWSFLNLPTYPLITT